ncbi:MAG TPA: hypothetical protein VG777_09580 [Thermoanaerobaculia bacterium]|nr:hypothetical protein [Thermoanaerobaculia bacterium]
MKKLIDVRLALLLAAIFAISAPARAQNLLTNPGFDGTLDPWDTSLYVTFDAGQSATADGTGSALVELPDSVPPGQFLVLRQCVAVVPGTTYSFGGKMRISSASGAGGSGYAFLEWHAASDCSDSRIGVVQTANAVALPPGPTDVWSTVEGIVTAPANATYALMLPTVEITGPLPVAASGIRREAAVQNLIVNVDDVFLTPLASTVPMLGAAGLAALVASLAGAAILVLRR